MSDFKPFLIAWNLTKRCNLFCDHCYLSAGEREAGEGAELTTPECLHIVDEMCNVNPASILVLTGGEPLLRKDLPEIASHAKRKGMMVVVGTNGTLLAERKVLELKEAGVMGVSISVDSLVSSKHDRFHGFPGALEKALNGIEACRRNDMAFQVHTTASRLNYEEIPSMIDFAYSKGARVFNLFFLVCTGRGEAMTDITPQQYEEVLNALADVQDRYPGMLIRSRCAPHFKRIVYEKDPANPFTKAQGYEGGGCLAGTHYARITPEGNLTPCPFLPITVGNLRQDTFNNLWNDSPVFRSLRFPHLKGKCGECEYSILCGGCRARPFVSHGDLFDEDLWCLYMPKGGPVIQPMGEMETEFELVWTKEAANRLHHLPFFLQKMIKKRVEQSVGRMGLDVVTLPLLETLRKKAFGGAAPPFRVDRKPPTE